MPIYEYRCASCGFQNEYLQRVSDPRLTECPCCGKATFNKLVTAAGFQLKGSGWYVTDFKNNGVKAKTGKDEKSGESQSEKAEPKKEEKTESKKEEKTESKKEDKSDPTRGTGASPAST